MYEAVCPNGHRLQVPIEHAGMKLRCPACNAIFQLQLPNGAAGVATAPSPTSGAATPAPAPSTTGTSTTAGTAPESGGRWSGTDAGTAPVPSPAAQGPAPGPVSARSSLSGVASGLAGLGAQVHLLSQALLVCGLLLALSARGCENVAAKSVVRLQGQVDLEQRIFDEKREEEVLALQTELNATKSSAARESVQKKLDDKQAEYDKLRKELQAGEWRLLANAASRASAENRGASYWREIVFLVGSILLAFGLAATALTGQGVERWVCFGLLTIIVFSLYVGGMAWAPSLVSNLR